MKKLIPLIIIIITPLTVLASSLKTSGFEYELTKIENKCEGSENLQFIGTSADQKLYYLDKTGTIENITEIAKVQDKDNKCSNIEPAELLNLLHRKTTNYDVETEGDNVIISIYADGPEEDGYLKTTDTEIKEGKFYYEKIKITVNVNGVDEEEDAIQIVSEPKVENIANYYELLYYTYPSKTEVEAGVTYYTVTDYDLKIIEKVTEPKAEELFTYVVVTEDPMSEMGMRMFKNSKLASALNNPKSTWEEATPIPGTEKYLFLTHIEQDDGTRLISVYDETGKELFKNFEGFRPINENLYFGYHDGKTQFYNKLRVKFHTEDIENLYPTNYFDNEKVIYLSDGKDAYKLAYKTVPVTENPNTSDELVIVIIIGLVSLVGLSKTTSKHRRKHRIN